MTATRFKLTPYVPAEADIQSCVLEYLRWHPKVAWIERVNSGSAWLPGKGGQERPVQFHTISGCSDLIGMLKTGQFLAVECKRPGKAPTPLQAAFLARVKKAGGVSGYATSIESAKAILEAA